MCVCWKNVFCIFGMESSINVNQDKLPDSVDQIFYILTDFCLPVLSVIQREILRYLTIIVNLCILHKVKSFLALCILSYVLMNQPFIIMKKTSSSLLMKFTWCYINIAILAFYQQFQHDIAYILLLLLAC